MYTRYKEITEDNWKDIALLQETMGQEILNVYFLQSKGNYDSDNLLLEINMETLSESDYKYDKDTIVSALKEAYSNFPTCVFDNAVSLQKQSNTIAENAHRGAGTTLIGNTLVYQGDHSSAIDGPIIVANRIVEGEEKFAIFLHPKYEDYGFCFTDERTEADKESMEPYIETI